MGNSWKKKPLGSLCNGIGDGVHGTPKYVVDSPYCFINGNNLKDGRVDTSSAKRVDGDEYQKHFVELDETTLLMSINGTLGSLALYRGESVILGKSAAYIRCRDISREFCYYYFQLRETQRAFFNIATGSTIKNLSLDSIKNFHIPVPSVQEQKAISNVLSALDSKIELNHRINGELEGMAKLLYDYWFVQYDFPLSAAQAAALGKPHLAGKPYRSSGGPMVYHEQLNREIPKGWEVRELESFLTLAYGKALKKTDHQSGLYPVYGSGGIYGWHHEALVAGPGIIVGRKGTVGSIHWEDHDFYPTDTTYYVIPTDGYTLIYLALLLKTLDLASMNTDSAVPGLNRNNAYSREVACPPMDLVKAFTEIVNPMRTMMSSLAKQNQELTTLRDWLLPMLMNGQVRVG